MAEQKKAVLMIHIDQEQGQLWQSALETQQLNVVWESLSLDLVQYLGNCDRQNLPALLLLDMAVKSPNSETLQSSSVCQWVGKQQVPTKVVLFNPRQDRIKDIEHSWALRRGASDVLPRLSRENLMAEVARVTALIGCSLISQPLEKIAQSLSSTSNKLTNEGNTQALEKKSESTTKNKTQSNRADTKSDGDNVVMYRGVRVRR
ncbi:hypothetical protein H6F42_17915 [Pseudanabaena sp. FACHB-1998]|uniref:hypothetical protein n=1 Tax=Pseudanabaena sp. FACHB-1998 TaxID=2692858 RepID=UPI0016810A32|nr:hypothetical protein [Pseudanabaena sp. FACHB-1998]MBD2178799.1 hypothetical protein [Pseudanabaena sp. FACHB-1998]